MIRKVARAVTYARQSKQREDDSAVSPEAQRRATRAQVEAKGWQFVRHFEDVGRSGYDPKAKRPGLDALLAAIEAGEADKVVIYKLDRLTRQGVAEAVRLVDLLARHGAALVSVEESFLDTGSKMGQGIFALFAAMASQESENISTRTTAAKALLRVSGSHAGGRAPYGYSASKVLRDGLTIRTLEPNAREADVVRDIARRVLEGESLRQIARELNRRGIRPRSGAEWSTGTLSRVLQSPTVAGYMPEHRPERNAPVPRDEMGRLRLAIGEDGMPLQPWEPIISPEEWYRLLDVIESRPVSRGSEWHQRPSLLAGTAGLLTCECGGKMSADRRPGGFTSHYRCMRHRRGSEACKGVSVAMEHTDSWVTLAVLRRIAALDPANRADAALLDEATKRYAARVSDPEATAERQTLETAVRQLREALDRLDDDRAAGLFEGATGAERYARQVRTLTARLGAASERLAALPAASDVSLPWLDLGQAASDAEGMTGAVAVWESWDLSDQRSFLALFVEDVTVRKATGPRGGRAAFDGDQRLVLHWRGDDAAPGSRTTPQTKRKLPPRRAQLAKAER
jgi:site-specific DNA recombinase